MTRDAKPFASSCVVSLGYHPLQEDRSTPIDPSDKKCALQFFEAIASDFHKEPLSIRDPTEAASAANEKHLCPPGKFAAGLGVLSAIGIVKRFLANQIVSKVLRRRRDQV